jgi:hypothetical protein
MSAQPKHDLQKSAQDLLDEMEKLITGSQNPAFNTQLAMRALHKFAGVLAVVSLAADKHSRRLVYLTWVLVALTAALLVFAIALYEDSHFQIQSDQAQKHHELQAPKPPETKP